MYIHSWSQLRCTSRRGSSTLQRCSSHFSDQCSRAWVCVVRADKSVKRATGIQIGQYEMRWTHSMADGYSQNRASVHVSVSAGALQCIQSSQVEQLCALQLHIVYVLIKLVDTFKRSVAMHTLYRCYNTIEPLSCNLAGHPRYASRDTWHSHPHIHRYIHYHHAHQCIDIALSICIRIALSPIHVCAVSGAARICI